MYAEHNWRVKSCVVIILVTKENKIKFINIQQQIKSTQVVKQKQNEKSAQRDANTARCICRRGPSSISVPNLERIALFVHKLLGVPKFRPAADPLPGPITIHCAAKLSAQCNEEYKDIKGRGR